MAEFHRESSKNDPVHVYPDETTVRWMNSEAPTVQTEKLFVTGFISESEMFKVRGNAKERGNNHTSTNANLSDYLKYKHKY